ncbi:MAG: HEAT repeat domain-containing protein [Geopsychrobacter sp.]|nr:HEAT repeat domain-containing protein [Geopsychrobacter sp.]
MAATQLILEFEQALTGLVKLMKALRFYPEKHPSLENAIEEVMTAFGPMLKHQHKRAIQCSQTGFTLDDNPIGEKNPALPDLARLLVERRVNQLIFLPDLPISELMIFLQGLSTSAEEIYRIGGLPVFLRNHQVSTIWINESSLDGALHKRQQLAEELENTTIEIDDQRLDTTDTFSRSDLAQQLHLIIEQLSLEQHDDAYRLQIDKLLRISPQYFAETGPPGIMRILSLLLNHSQQKRRSRPQRSISAGAIDRLLTAPTGTLLCAQFKSTALSPQQYQRLQQLIVGLGIKIAPQLLAQMSKEEDGTVRKRLSTLLGRMGEPLLELLREMVHNNKWYVVRNAVTLLGNLRLEAGIEILTPLTRHSDPRVRRALIRALAMIGGKNSVPLLLTLTRDQNVTLRRPAVKALGATRCAEAVRPLLSIAQKFDPFGRKTELRSDAISALGVLNPKEALVPLLALAKRPNLLHLQRLEELRAEIILTLGKLGNKELDSALKKWQKSPHAVVQRAAELSSANLAKRYDHPTTD